MRYFIGCLLRGEVAEYYSVTCADLASRFGIANVSTIVPPHITVKSPFERVNAESIDNLVALNTEVAPMPMTLTGWNHFGTRTIFIDGEKPSDELQTFVSDIVGKLRSMGIPVSPDEANAQARVSIARFLKTGEYENIWKYLQSVPAPKFDIKFDNLTIFYKENRDDKVWKVLKTFPLLGAPKK